MNILRSLRRAALGLIVTGWMVSPASIARGQVFPGGPTPDPMALKPYGVAVMGGTAFTFDLYAQLKGGNGATDNLFFSPYSISSALAMTRLGARGDTAQEMSSTLRLNAEVSAIESSYAALTQSLTGDVAKQGYTLSVANALWGQKGEPFLPDYLDVVKKDFGAALTPVDFITQSEAARKQINDWVADKTQDKIKDLLVPGTVTPDSRLVLTNAIYFKGKWSDPFVVSKTIKGDFRTLHGEAVKADMMHRTSQLLYAEDDLCQAAELPYKGDQLAMLVLLPKADIDLAGEDGEKTNEINTGMVRLEGALNPNYLDKITGQLADRSVNLALPKWEATQEFMLGDVLQAMRMKLAFTPNADFSGINGRKDLSISNVIHKAYVKVDEEGTEAAAATANTMYGGGIPHTPPPPVNFTADHAFVYFIIHKPTQAILFAGRLCDPTPGK